MASSKTLLLLLCALFALVLIASAEVSSSETKSNKGTEVEEDQYGGGYNGGRGGNGGYPGGGYNGGRGRGGYPGGGRGGRGRCYHGCCRGYRYQPGCYRCCSNANEMPDAAFEDDVKN